MIGFFRYLNAYPYWRLIEEAALPYRVFSDPKAVAEAWQSGSLSAALLPVRYVGPFARVLSWGIGSAGPVQSVLLLSEYPPSTWEALVPDPASTSSITLLKWLIGRGLLPSWPVVSYPDTRRTGRLFIGDSALRWKKFYPYQIDIGEMVHKHVRMPFAYAVWCVRRESQRTLRKVFGGSWDLFTWAEAAACEYRLSASQVYAYWQSLRYRLPRFALRWWHSRLNAVSAENLLPLNYASNQ